jgi:hypothetical protein
MVRFDPKSGQSVRVENSIRRAPTSGGHYGMQRVVLILAFFY